MGLRCKALVVFTYLVTKDLVYTLERKFGFPLEDATRDKIFSLEKNFLQEFWKYIPDSLEKVELDASFVSQKLEDVLAQKSYPVISLDRIYFSALRSLEVTRLTNPVTGEVNLASRPGSKVLEEQIEQIKEQEVVLTDVGAFDGGTILKVVSLLENNGTNVAEIVLGISSTKAYERLQGLNKVTTLNLFDIFEWIELRDLFGIDGRNVDFDRGSRLFIPYWENLSQWASISGKDELSVKKLCKEYNQALVGLLWQEGFNLNKIGIPVKYGGK